MTPFQFVSAPLLVAVEAYKRDGQRKRAFAEMQGAPAHNSVRVLALLDSASRALHAGHGQLAAHTADEALALDPGNQSAGILKARAAELLLLTS